MTQKLQVVPQIGDRLSLDARGFPCWGSWHSAISAKERPRPTATSRIIDIKGLLFLHAAELHEQSRTDVQFNTSHEGHGQGFPDS